MAVDCMPSVQSNKANNFNHSPKVETNHSPKVETRRVPIMESANISITDILYSHYWYPVQITKEADASANKVLAKLITITTSKSKI